MDYIKAEVRLEGESNRNWTLTRDDGVEEKFYSIDGSPQYEDAPRTDERVYDIDPKLAEFLEELSFLCPAEGDEVIEYTVELPSRQVTVTLTEVV